MLLKIMGAEKDKNGAEKNVSWTGLNRIVTVPWGKTSRGFNMISNYSCFRTAKRYDYWRNLRRCRIVSVCIHICQIRLQWLVMV